MGAKAGQRKGPPPRRQAVGRKRLWLVVFAAALVAIFVIFAVAQGIGAPSVPSGDAAIVKSVPSDANTVSEAEVKRATGQQIAAARSEGSIKKAPKSGSKKYEEIRQAAMAGLLDQIWVRGAAEELGVSVTPKQIETELATIKKQNFPTAKAYDEFLERSHYTQEEVDAQIELQILSTEIEERIKGETEPVTASEIQAYYEAEKAAQFTTPASRDIRVVVNKDKAKVEAAKKALEGDQSVKNWQKVAGKYSSDTTTKSTGGLQKAVTEEFVKGELKKAIFGSATGELVGPVEYEENFLLIEPVKLNREKVKTLAEVRSQISQTLSQKKQEEFFSEFVSEYQSKWTSRTFCASDFAIERCANYPASKALEKSREAYKACFEEESKLSKKEKAALKAGCPAPVTMNTPAIPGSVTEKEPKGERLVQRPQPVGLAGGKAGKAAEAVEGAVEGATGE